MNRILLMVGVLSLVIGAWFATRSLSIRATGAGEVTSESMERSRGTKSARGAKSRRPAKSRISPTDAAKRLRHFLEADLSDRPTFDELDALAQHLETDDLRELVELAGLADMQRLVPWVRCALFAEWGRRDPEAAMAYLRDPDTENNTEGWSARQAWFSLFRGWAENDPDEALATLQGKPFALMTGRDPFSNSVEEMMRELLWQEPAHEAIFRELARRDGIAAWERVPPDPDLRFPAMAGVIGGIDGRSERLALARRWGPEWTAIANAGSGNQETYSKIETLRISAAGALAEIDLELAAEWLTELHSSDEPLISTAVRISRVIENWATQHPERALERIESAGQSEVIALARGILRTDPALGPQALASIGNTNDRAEVLRANFQVSTPFRDFFPEPGRRTNLRDFPQRHQALSAAITNGGFPPEQQEALRNELDEAYLGFLEP